MKKTIITLTIIVALLFIVFILIYFFQPISAWEDLSITFGVIFYHFIMRLLVGHLFDKTIKNHIDYTKKWFLEKPFEKNLYNFLCVKKWKKFMPTFKKEYFNLKIHSIEEIIMAGCQAEIVHESIMVLSLFPIVLCVWFKPYIIFILTSILSVLIDGLFVIVQRYNRPRLNKILNCLKEKQFN